MVKPAGPAAAGIQQNYAPFGLRMT